MDARAPEPFVVEHRTLVLVAIGVLLYVPFLGLRDLWYPDEPDIAEVCRAMFVGGDWIVPHRNGQPWIDYWPALYWAGAASSHALGAMSEFSLRLPSAIGGILLALGTCAFASRRFGPRAGLWAGVLLLTFGQFAYNAVSYRPDVLFSLFGSGGVLLYASGANRDAPRWLPRIGGFVLFGLAVLVKGPLGLLLPGLVLTLWHGARREWKLLFSMAPLTVAALATALPWALACAHETSSEWFWGEIYAQNFARFDEGGRGHIKPWHYYLANIWGDLAPWSPLLPFAVVWLVRSPLRRDRAAQLALLWFGVSFVFLSYASTKRQLYLLPAYPAIALLIAPYLAALGGGGADGGSAPDPRPARWLLAGLCALIGVVGVALLLGGALLDPILGRLTVDGLIEETVRGMRWPAIASGAGFVGLAWWLLRAVRGPDLRAALWRTALVVVAVQMIAWGALIPAANPLKTYVPACRWVREQIGPDEDQFGVLFPGLSHHKMGAFGYYTGAQIALLDDEAAVDAFFAAHPGSIVLVHADSAPELFRSTRTDWRAAVVRELIAGRYPYFAIRAPG